MRRQSTTVEEEIARIAGAHHGVITRAQLLAAGLSVSAIDRRVRKGLLLPEHRSVYRVGHRAPSLEARYLAAVGDVLEHPRLMLSELRGLLSRRRPP